MYGIACQKIWLSTGRWVGGLFYFFEWSFMLLIDTQRQLWATVHEEHKKSPAILNLELVGFFSPHLEENIPMSGAHIDDHILTCVLLYHNPAL